MVKQNETHYTLPQEELDKGFIRPVREKYVHDKCGGMTKMGIKIAETYARKPDQYSRTYCVHCEDYFPVEEFKWDGTTEVVGS